MGLPEHSSSKAAAVSLMTASEAILCYFYNILLVTQAQGCESQEVGLPGAALEAACHQALALLCLSGPPPVPLFFFFLNFFVVGYFKSLYGIFTILLLFHVLVFWPLGIWDLSSLTRDQTGTPHDGRQSLTHWTAREAPCRPS